MSLDDLILVFVFLACAVLSASCVLSWRITRHAPTEVEKQAQRAAVLRDASLAFCVAGLVAYLWA